MFDSASLRSLWSCAADAVPITVELGGVARVTTVDESRTSCTNRPAVGVVSGPISRRGDRRVGSAGEALPTLLSPRRLMGPLTTPTAGRFVQLVRLSSTVVTLATPPSSTVMGTASAANDHSRSHRRGLLEQSAHTARATEPSRGRGRGAMQQR